MKATLDRVTLRVVGPSACDITACLNAHDDERHVVMLPLAIHKN
jgi:hypothetical protein